MRGRSHSRFRQVRAWLDTARKRTLGGKGAIQSSRMQHFFDLRLCVLSRTAFPWTELVTASLQLHFLRMVGLAIPVLNDLLDFDRLLDGARS